MYAQRHSMTMEEAVGWIVNRYLLVLAAARTGDTFVVEALIQDDLGRQAPHSKP